MTRTATALVTFEDHDVGAIGPFPVASPWWADVEPIAAYCRAVLGVNVVVLRLVDVDGGKSPRGGHVTYHVEALSRPDRAAKLSGASASFADLRQPARGRAAWASADGVRQAVRWALDQLDAAGFQSSGELEHVKSWNLSSLFRIPVVGSAPIWLKLTADFSACEAAVIGAVATADASLVPKVVGSNAVHRRALLSHVPGVDCWNADRELIQEVLTRWVTAQAQLAARPRPPAAAVPDRRPEHLVRGLRGLLSGEAGAQLSAGELAAAEALADRLPELVAALERTGLPLTVVHGDFHPGNWRSDGDRVVLIDFADAYWGHPALDGERLREFVGAEREQAVVDAWCAAWRAQRPRSDPETALRLARPLQALSGAIAYQNFLDHIEASERRYHELDPPAGIRDAIAAAPDLDLGELSRL